MPCAHPEPGRQIVFGRAVERTVGNAAQRATHEFGRVDPRRLHLAIGAAAQTRPKPGGFGRSCVRKRLRVARQRIGLATRTAVDAGGSNGGELGHDSLVPPDTRQIRTRLPVGRPRGLAVRICPTGTDYNGVMTIETAIVTFPLGTFRATVEEGVVRGGRFEPTPAPVQRDQWGVYDALAAYFAGEVDALDRIATEPEHGTVFQREVWKHLREIPAGTTVSYGELAERVGRPSASRAVGMANASNPIALIVPCHRVVRTGGALGGYAYGLDYKRWLLAHESNMLAAV